MKLAICSDIHFHNWTQFARIGTDGLNSRLKLTYDRVVDILKGAAEEKCAAILFAGDLFHSKKIDAEVLDIAARAFAVNDIPIIGIAGNHDTAVIGEDPRHSSRAISRITWIAGTMRSQSVGDRGESVSVLGMPYNPSGDSLLSELKNIFGNINGPKGYNILLLHVGIVGSMAGDGYIPVSGDAVAADSLAAYADLVVCGHYHTSQVIMDGTRPKILIPGAPEQHNFGDSSEDRGYWIYNTNGTTKFCPLGSPKFMVVKSEDVNKGLLVGNYYKVQGELREMDKEMIKSFSAGTIIEGRLPEAVTVARPFHAKMSDKPEDILAKYVETSATKLDKKALLGIGMDFLK